MQLKALAEARLSRKEIGSKMLRPVDAKCTDQRQRDAAIGHRNMLPPI